MYADKEADKACSDNFPKNNYELFRHSFLV